MMTEADIKPCSKLVIQTSGKTAAIDIDYKFRAALDVAPVSGFEEVYSAAKFCESFGYFVVIKLTEDTKAAYPVELYPIDKNTVGETVPTALAIVLFCGCCKCLGDFCYKKDGLPYLFNHSAEVSFDSVYEKEDGGKYLCTYLHDEPGSALDSTLALMLFKRIDEDRKLVLMGSWNVEHGHFQDILGNKLEVSDEIIKKAEGKFDDLKKQLKQRLAKHKAK